ncbi:nucleoredoxin-like [Seminavis robusta]|uniref:Nucleoredoxin-like n=1 Tax=Seminavis robusta TaxID=568900 RepID=A0A9N8DWX6_9STRA|nr:nucleoredoxin-like [Seminavis robusta]|eukprot:Sro355_g125160.1 nucleoredoxin-like (358) ;mRNA; r:67930-69003
MGETEINKRDAEAGGSSEPPAKASKSENGSSNGKALTAQELAKEFPSLAELFASPAPILALYFASAWCPDCTGVTPVVDEVFSKKQPADKLFDLVYVSSDNSEEQLKGNLPSEGWGFVPFDNVEERSNLKRHFGSCAAKEVSVLEMKPEDRKSGIPTLILLEAKTGKVLTRDGVDDIMGVGGTDTAINKWKGLLPAKDLTAEELAKQFPSLSKPISSPAPILALYFASAWCPDCTGVTPVVDEAFSKKQPADKLFDLVYVSSDNSEEQLKGNLPSEGWGFVPFENVEERSNLKRHFGSCAAKEVSTLNMKPEDRKSGIPTLILLEAKTGKVLTRDGVDDIMGEGGTEAAINKWKGMI